MRRRDFQSCGSALFAVVATRNRLWAANRINEAGNVISTSDEFFDDIEFFVVSTLPVPVVVKLLTSQVRIGRGNGTAPEIEVDFLGNRIVTQCVNRLAAFVADTASEVDFSDTVGQTQFASQRFFSCRY